MTRGRWATGPAATAAVVMIALAGCSSDAPTVEVVPTGAAQAYVDAVIGSTAESTAQHAIQAEERVARCMAAQGFEYVPYPGAYHLVDEATIDPPPGSRAFAEEFGYGYARSPAGMAASDEGGTNPNDPITAAMSESELDQYLAAYLGADPTAQDADPAAMGCMGEGIEVFRGASQDPVGAALVAEVARIEQTAAPADTRVVALDDAWAACMADAGHPGYQHQPDAEADWFASWVAYNDEVSAQGGAAAGSDGEPVVDDDVLARERALATVDWDCRAEVDYAAGVAAVQDEMQQEYVDAHRSELDAWVERWAERGSS